MLNGVWMLNYWSADSPARIQWLWHLEKSIKKQIYVLNLNEEMRKDSIGVQHHTEKWVLHCLHRNWSILKMVLNVVIVSTSIIGWLCSSISKCITQKQIKTSKILIITKINQNSAYKYKHQCIHAKRTHMHVNITLLICWVFFLQLRKCIEFRTKCSSTVLVCL